MALIQDNKLRLPSLEFSHDVISSSSLRRADRRAIISSSSDLAWSGKSIVVDDDEVERSASELWEVTLFPTFPIPDGDGVVEWAMGGNLIDPHIDDGHGADYEHSTHAALLMSNASEVNGNLGLPRSGFHEQGSTPLQLKQPLQSRILVSIGCRLESVLSQGASTSVRRSQRICIQVVTILRRGVRSN